ncbi:unnamed protein product [Acanthoscelides obtectus]|uniref:N-acetylglucosaminylphosphatidylinositol deacetylase n=1 Tax=Acanthoscelides obtectus TaxID=200917 RepID=A0A9P0JP74_ACAOB|nr:unnamed protein product [Acanthoscelides obtectus]CAK1641396.1 N-acetylglucosaminyl-phosphatidylinositol de-N-acetylase [Acanthoscelides obtectus]
MYITFPDFNEIDHRLLLEDICEWSHNLFLRFFQYLVDTAGHLGIACILYVLLNILLYILIIRWGVVSFNRNARNFKRVLFVIAHPDDECMFFGPTILNYTRKENCTVYLMCLSTGKSYGMGSVRKNELYKSCQVLGIPQNHIMVHNHTLLPDAMDVRWPIDVVAELISKNIDSLGITALITFDRYGVSNHYNHCSIYYGIASLIFNEKIPKGCGIYVLESINVFRKYWSVLDIPISLILSRFRVHSSCNNKQILLVTHTPNRNIKIRNNMNWQAQSYVKSYSILWYDV